MRRRTPSAVTISAATTLDNPRAVPSRIVRENDEVELPELPDVSHTLHAYLISLRR
jgi:hypothetical protein